MGEAHRSPAEVARFAAAAHRREANTRRASPLACQRAFAAVLDTWAINADLRALEAENMGQPDLFGDRNQ